MRDSKKKDRFFIKKVLFNEFVEKNRQVLFNTGSPAVYINDTKSGLAVDQKTNE